MTACVVHDLDARADVVGRAGAVAEASGDGSGKLVDQFQHDIGRRCVRVRDPGKRDVASNDEAVDPLHRDSGARRGTAQTVLLLFAIAPSAPLPLIPFCCVSCARSP